MKVLEKLGEEKKRLTIQGILFVIVAILIFLLPFERAAQPNFNIIGKAAALVIIGATNLYIIYLLLVAELITRGAKQTIWIYIVGAIGFTLISFFRGGVAGAKAAVMMIVMLNVGLAMGFVDYEKLSWRIYILDIGFLIYIGAIARHYIKLEERFYSYSFLYNNPNYLGLMCLLMIFLCLLAYGMTEGKRYFIYPLPLMWVIKLSKSRTAIVSLAAVLMVLLLWKLITKYKGIYYTFFALLISGIMGMTIIYPSLNTMSVFEDWNEKMVQSTGKKIFTGREKQWEASLELIKEKPLIGYGMDSRLEELTEEELSTHNIYLQLLLQGGSILLLMFFALIYWIWRNLYHINYHILAKIGASCFVGILVIGILELTLLGQSISLGIIQWLMIGSSVSLSFRRKFCKAS